MEYFKKLLPIRVGDMYHGMEISMLFEIIDILNNGTMEDAVKKFYDQGHSGMSASLTARLVQRFHKKLGDEFYNKVYASV